MSNYRKIYEKHYGDIPKDSNGRTYEIHHIDGNHTNNSPENLRAVTIQEHLEMHESQNNWYACLKIAERLKLSHEEISELAKKNAHSMVENGTHPFLTRPDGTSVSSDRAAAGTNPFQTRSDGSNLQIDRVKEGTHPFQTRPDGSNLQTDRIAAGTHNLLGGEIQRKTQQRRVADGTHHLLGGEIGGNNSRVRVANGTHNLLRRVDGTSQSSDRVANGSHNFLGAQEIVKCPYCPIEGGTGLMKRWHFDNCKFK